VVRRMLSGRKAFVAAPVDPGRPHDRRRAALEGEEDMSTMLPQTGPAKAEPRERARILIVDDERAARATVAALLDDEFEVLTAESGHEAFALLERRPIDVVCTDYDMPGMTGIELLRLMFLHVPCTSGVLVTGHREYLSTPPNCTKGRVFDIALKPFNAPQFLRTIARALDRTLVAREILRRTPRATAITEVRDGR
jgi:DNA-binding NtrC family response regulator